MGKSFHALGRALICMLAVGLSGNAWAGTWNITDSLSASYNLTLNYALAWRAEKPSNSLLNGPVDPFQAYVGQNGQLIGFSHSGLSNTINSDDGNRNFDQYDLFHNRITAFGELSFSWKNYGLVFSGSSFYDDVYYGHNSNDSVPFSQAIGNSGGSTINKTGAPDRFTDATRYYQGKRSRLLEAYAYGGFSFNDMYLDVRVGQQLVAWGQSLFLSGLASAMGPADATKAFVPGAQIKDILLPVNQIGVRLSVNLKLTLLADYKLDYRHTEVFPNGSFFSPADLVGPGSTFGHGSINPAAGNGCPGLLGPLSSVCELPILGPLLNAPPYILVQRLDDIEPSKKNQWGVGFTYQLTSSLNIGVYHLNYHDTNPTVQLNTGYAFIGSVAGVPITTQVINQPVPVTYQIRHFDNIKFDSITFTTVLFGFNVAGEFNYRRGVPTPVQAMISGVRSPIYVRSDQAQVLISALYTYNPGFLVDSFTFVGEAGYVRVLENDKLTNPKMGVHPVGDGGELYFDKQSYGFQTRFQTSNRNILPGWDLNGTMTYGMIIEGNPPMAGAFGALFGEGIKRLSIGADMQYLQNFTVGASYVFFLGDPDKIILGDANGPVRQNPYADHDYFTLNFKYRI